MLKTGRSVRGGWAGRRRVWACCATGSWPVSQTAPTLPPPPTTSAWTTWPQSSVGLLFLAFCSPSLSFLCFIPPCLKFDKSGEGGKKILIRVRIVILAFYIGFLESIHKLCKFPSSLLASAHLGHFVHFWTEVLQFSTRWTCSCRLWELSHT